MKLLLDMYPSQVAFGVGEVGCYTLGLARGLARMRGWHEVVALANPGEARSFELLRQEFIRLLPAGSFLPYYQPALDWGEPDIESRSRIAGCFVHQAYQAVSADVILYAGFMEGYGQGGITPSPGKDIPSAKRVAILYDFIPSIFPDQYLDKGIPGYKKWYLGKLAAFKRFDFFLSVSEQTRQDAIRFLGILPERIVTIPGAAGLGYHQREWGASERETFLRGHGISRPYIFFLGGGDYCKNRDGLLASYAKLPRSILDQHQLVINAKADREWYVQQASLLGLAERDIVVTDCVADEQLSRLYNLSRLFVFPSLYEGSGLPILDAMASGALVIASNNSSIPEVVGNSDLLFEAGDDRSMSGAIEKALTDEQFREGLSGYGLERARQFSWEESARRVWEALENLEQETPVRRYNQAAEATTKLKIAYLSPLPPEESGISYYSADLLPQLAKHFEIDLFVTPGLQVEASLARRFRVYPWTELLKRQEEYATVVYHVGNSPFHSHMFDLARQIPGVVVLHDFFVGNLVAHDTLEGGFFPKKLEESHGLRSMLEISARGLKDVIEDWPINWPLLRNAQELVVHSDYHEHLLRQYYGRGWRPGLRIIKQLRSIPGDVSLERRQSSRRGVGLGADEFVICSFGFLNPIKFNLLTIEAFGRMQERCGGRGRLVFVGDVNGPETYRAEISELIERLGLQDKVGITGFVSKGEYEKYMLSADVAIQLRINSRGETSRAVLDCMAYGLPTIVNAHATLNDYSEEEVVKLAENPTVEVVAEAMMRLYEDEQYRKEKGRKALEAIRENHDPEKLAAAYADVIYGAALTSDRRIFAPAWAEMAKRGDADVLVRSHARMAAANLSLRTQPKIWMDVTATFENDLRTGIQRVVKNLSKKFLTMETARRFEMIHYSNGKMYSAFQFVERLFDLPPNSLPLEQPAEVNPGDMFFLPDSSWHLYPHLAPFIERIRQQGGKIASMVYDILPVRYPEKFPDYMRELFAGWLNFAVTQSDMMVCISRAIADEILEYIDTRNIPLQRKMDVNYIHLGADILIMQDESKIRKHVSYLVERRTIPLFLAVGTLEPRKGHHFMLDAFERLWEQGETIALCFAGKIGQAWEMNDLERRIREHPQSRRRFFFIENPSDAELNALYNAATSVMTASTAEGFGLPIVEGALHKVPVLASDIPVFREVGGEGAMYFSLESPMYLAEAVKAMLALSPEERQAMVAKIETLTWKESAEWTLEVLEGRRVYKSLRPTPGA